MVAKPKDIVIHLVTKVKGDGLKDAEKGLESLGKKSETAGGLFSKFGSKLSTLGDNVGKNLTKNFGAAGDAAGKLGIATEAVGGVAGVAAGAIAGLGAAVYAGVGKLKELYDNTRAFNEVAGTTWEEGSRLIAVFDDLRVSSDEGASAMGKLTKTVGSTPQVLGQFGIDIARAKDGTVDMTGTLANVATAFQNTADPAKRAALGSALFGKSWQNIVPVLEQGGDSLKKLIAGVDDSQVATAKGAKQQDELFEATDNLHDAIDGLEREVAQNLIPTLTELATVMTTVLGTADDIGHVIGEVSRLGGAGKDILAAADNFVHFGKASDHVAESADRVIRAFGPTATNAVQALAAGVNDLSGRMETTKRRAEAAKDAYKEWTQSTKDLLEQQEKLRDAQLATEDSTLALEQAQIAAGDSSGELSDKAKLAAEAIEQHGASSTEAKIAVEEHRRAVVDARGAMNEAAQAAVNNAQKQAEAAGTTLTAAEKTKVYRDELIRLRDGAKDPDLIAALDAQIGRLADVAAQAQNAAANLHGLAQAMNDAAGIERNFTGRDSSGVAVTRRASGGPVWPNHTYLVGENGPELMRFDGTGPGEVLSNPQSQQQGDWPILSGKGKGSSPTITRNADGTVMFSGDPATYPGSVAGGAMVRAPKVAIRPLGLGESTGSTLSLGGSGGGGGGGTFNIVVNVTNAVIGNRQELADYLTKILDDYARARL